MVASEGTLNDMGKNCLVLDDNKVKHSSKQSVSFGRSIYIQFFAG